MGQKIDFEADERAFVVTQAPVNGRIELDLQVDLYSDGKEDWLDDGSFPDLSKMIFPVDAKGGEDFGQIVLGSSWLILNGWHFVPYEEDHTMVLIGNIGTAGDWELIHDTIGNYTVRVEYQVSDIVSIRETGVSGLTAAESAALLNIDAKVDAMAVSVANMLTIVTGIEVRDLAEHITNPITGIVEVVNHTSMRRWRADGYEDIGKLIPYKGEGLEVVEGLTEVAY